MQSAFGAIFLQDPFPRRLALTGAITQANQRGELTLWELDTPAAGVGRLGWQLQQAANAGDAPASDALSSGIFNICQRPGTEEVVYTTFGPGVHVVRLQRGPLSDDSAQDMSQDGSLDGSGHGSTLPAWVGHTNLTSQFAALKSDSVHLNPASYYDFAHVCQLIGHSNGCSAVRAAKCSAMTASFDGSLKLFHLPPPSVNDGGAPDPPVEINAAASYEDHASHMGGPPNSDQVEPVCSLDLSRDWTRMASGGNDMQVKVWDVATQRIVLRLQGHQGWIWHMEAEDHGLNRCVTSSTDGTVRTWDFRAGVQTGCLNLSQHYNGECSALGSLSGLCGPNPRQAGSSNKIADWRICVVGRDRSFQKLLCVLKAFSLVYPMDSSLQIRSHRCLAWCHAPTAGTSLPAASIRLCTSSTGA